MSDIQGSSSLTQVNVFKTDSFDIIKRIDEIYQQIPKISTRNNYLIDPVPISARRISQIEECLRGLCAINIDLLNKMDKLESKLLGVE